MAFPEGGLDLSGSDHLAVVVIAAVRTYTMRHFRLTAVRTFHQRRRAQLPMRSALIAPRL